ncbi:MAG: hypothetical protein AAF441_15170 [Pseudomonadota bacterium]
MSELNKQIRSETELCALIHDEARACKMTQGAMIDIDGTPHPDGAEWHVALIDQHDPLTDENMRKFRKAVRRVKSRYLLGPGE